MKKWIVMLAVLVMFCLVGCGEKPMTAVYFQADDNSWYFADLDTDTIFSGTIPDKLTDENGKKLTEEDMTDGDIYLIYGDGIMLESFPGQYPGITKMVRKEQGNQEKADQYRQELSSMMRPVAVELQNKLLFSSCPSTKIKLFYTKVLTNERIEHKIRISKAKPMRKRSKL